MRIGLLTQWYDPEPGPAALPGVLARGLRDRGHDVQVLTGFPNYPTGTIAQGYALTRKLDEKREGINVRRVALYPSHDSSAWRRFATYASFGVSASASGLGVMRGLDALWINYSPITVAWPMWAARFGLKVPAVTHVLDLWPDTILAGGFASGSRVFEVAAKGLHAWCRGMYASSASVAYISPSVGQILQQRGVSPDKLRYVPMWADEEIFRPSKADLRAELGLGSDQVVLLYAGALGEAQGLGTLIEACARVTEPGFVCLIAGSGAAEADLRERAAQLEATNVRFLGRVAQAEMTRLMATADLSYVSLRTHALSPVTMPSKTQAALAAGKALVVAAEGDVATVARESRAGFTAGPDDVVGIATAIETACRSGRVELERLGRQGRRYYEQTFSVAQGVGRVEGLLQEAAGGRPRA